MEKENKIMKKVESVSVDSFIQQAITSNAPVETLERLFTLHKEVKAENAKTAFIEALTNFQAQCPTIQKDKDVKNKDGRTVRYSYAPIDSVVHQIKGSLAENKLSYSWDAELREKHMLIRCKLTHILGHSETSTFEIPITESQFMTSPQSYATAQTYAKRYTLLNVLGIATADDDTDATDTGKEADAKDVKSQIIFRLRALGEKADTKPEIEEASKRLTKLELVVKNYQEIANRLSVLVAERNEA